MKEKNAIGWEPIPYIGLKKAQRSDFVTPEELADARRGSFDVTLTAYKNVPKHWFPQSVEGRRLLCLAGEAGVQPWLLAAARAQVTIFSRSDERLDRDREFAHKENLDISAILGDFANLSVFPKEYFDIIFCPASVPYVANVRQMYQECGRVLKHGGVLMMGVSLPSSAEEDIPFPVSEYSHTLEELIGGQIEAGSVIVGFYEDTDEDTICDYIPRYFATRALKI